MVAGSWALDQAIEKRWYDRNLDERFKAEWPDPTNNRYETIHDQEARPTPPGPYCVYTINPPAIVGHSTGSDEIHEEIQYLEFVVEFVIHAANKPGRSAKKIAVDLAKHVADAYDPKRPLVYPELDIGEIYTIRDADFQTREGDAEWSWTLRYRFMLDTSRISSTVALVVSPGQPGPPEPIPVLADEDSMLDAGDIGVIYDDPSKAVANRSFLAAYFSARAGKSVHLRFGGPANAGYNNKREPSDAYFDLSSGPIAITVGGAGVRDLVLEGLSTLHGSSPVSGITPLFQITRAAGTTPNITVRDLQVNNPSGSGLSFISPGATTRCENCHVTYGGTGSLDHDGFSDLDTASYALKVDEADGLFVTGFSCSSGGGHGVIVKRWHAGFFQGNVRVCDGVAFKGQKIAGTQLDLRAESNKGFGILCRDVGANRYSGGSLVASDGSPNDWKVHLEANNGRGTPHGNAGYRFSQFKMENCSRIRLFGHSGWRQNAARVDTMSRVRCEFVEPFQTELSQTAALALTASGNVSNDITLPQDAFGNSAITNWDVVWSDPSFRPVVSVVGTPGVDERIRIVWPEESFNNVDSEVSAYWRPWGGNASLLLDSPGAFRYEIQVKDVDGGASAYSLNREAASNRQMPFVMLAQIAPVSGATNGFPLLDQAKRWISGDVQIDDARGDIGPAIIAWTPGMGDEEGNAGQMDQHVIDVWALNCYKLNTNF